MFSLCCIATASAQLPGHCGETTMHQDSILKECEGEVFGSPLAFDVQFYLMKPFPLNFLELIDSNIVLLNEAFGGHLVFTANDQVKILETTINLVDLYDDYLADRATFDVMRKELLTGQINVILTATKEDTLQGSVLLGFTPVYSNWNEGFASQSPMMDNLLVSWEGMEKGTTLIHEMGHFMSLSHPWQLSYEERKLLELDSERSICLNFMNYSCFVNQFTERQLLQAYWFAKHFRGYLMK